MRDDLGVFIITHGRPDHVYTFNALIRSGYTGPIHVVIDNEDEEEERYRVRFGERVIAFDKAEAEKTIDTADTLKDRLASTFARNHCWTLAKDLGYRWFIILDDDYTGLQYRFPGKRGKWKVDQLLGWNIRSLDDVFEAFISFMEETGSATIAMAQGGDFIGGAEGTMAKAIQMKRKAMNSHLLRTDRPFEFPGRLNEDVTAYVRLGHVGELFWTYSGLQVTQKPTQENPGGISDTYREKGTYAKSFYSLLYSPSCVSIGMMGTVARRFHHRVAWDHAVPKILREAHRR